MARTKLIKETLFRRCAEQCKICEAIPFEAIGHRFEYEKFQGGYQKIINVSGDMGTVFVGDVVAHLTIR